MNSSNPSKSATESLEKTSEVNKGSQTKQNKQELRERYKRKKEVTEKALTFLSERYSECFNIKEPKPLKIDILKDIFKDLPEDGSIARIHIRKVISFYTSRYSYQKAIVEHTHRYGLTGDQGEEIEVSHKDHAQKVIEKKNQQKELREQKKEKVIHA